MNSLVRLFCLAVLLETGRPLVGTGKLWHCSKRVCAWERERHNMYNTATTRRNRAGLLRHGVTEYRTMKTKKPQINTVILIWWILADNPIQSHVPSYGAERTRNCRSEGFRTCLYVLEYKYGSLRCSPIIIFIVYDCLSYPSASASCRTEVRSYHTTAESEFIILLLPEQTRRQPRREHPSH